jgi:hypothetical protein
MNGKTHHLISYGSRDCLINLNNVVGISTLGGLNVTAGHDHTSSSENKQTTTSDTVRGSTVNAVGTTTIKAIRTAGASNMQPLVLRLTWWAIQQPRF